ncbi:MAG: hypothetical protein A2Y67_00115 [Candidatus Buchananbacteria bacterium RBG_13_39_9]|uniref:Antitoxin n=1 Tax=Candidatus Buchananbacteria bacterium RBG_13_39_9 TaxID=1797531 RepID=A0A1G1XQW1_9BACT|nr:MAG: hypothetical protein A2Y67_00115 [Candidatus Buchananbacteria bacterium RBG_13_39_9]
MKNFKRILDLIKKTGDKYIFENETGEIFIILSLDDYENYIFKNNQLKNLSEEELLNKINKDIALWKVSQEDKIIDQSWQDLPPAEKESSFAEASEDIEKEEEDRYYFEPAEDEE